jgi:hypothetical protein
LSRLRCLLAAIVFGAALIPLAAAADDNAQIFAGGQLDFANYVFVGATVALPGSSIGNGLALRGYVDTGGYDYVSGDVGAVKANFGGGELDGVYQLTRKNFWSNFGAGVNDTYTGLTPYDPGNRLRGDQLEARISWDGGDVTGPWRVDWLAFYGLRLADYEAMLGGTHALSPAWRLGLQVYGEGNPSYRLYQAGPYAGLTFAKSSEIQFSAGRAWEPGFTPRTYVKALLSEKI